MPKNKMPVPAFPNVIAGKLGRPFVQDPTSAVDMRAPLKGNLQGAAEKRVSMIRPSKGGNWGPFVKRPNAGPPASTNWRSSSKPVPGKR